MGVGVPVEDDEGVYDGDGVIVSVDDGVTSIWRLCDTDIVLLGVTVADADLVPDTDGVNETLTVGVGVGK